MTLNANGIRAAHRKGFFEWMLKQDVDVVCIQETKAQTHQLSEDILMPDGYSGFFNDAEKKGYSGVAIYSKQQLIKSQIALFKFQINSNNQIQNSKHMLRLRLYKNGIITCRASFGRRYGSITAFVLVIGY